MHQLLNQSASEITRRFAAQTGEKLRAPNDAMGMAEDWAPQRAPPHKFSDQVYKVEVHSINASEVRLIAADTLGSVCFLVWPCRS